MKQRFEVAADPGSNGAFPVDGPREHSSAVNMLNKPGQFVSIAPEELAGSDGLVEQLLRFVAESTELRESDGVKIRIRQINLKVGEAVGHSLGSRGERGAFRIQLNERLERRPMFHPGRGELLRNAGRRGAAHREQ